MQKNGSPVYITTQSVGLYFKNIWFGVIFDEVRNLKYNLN